jgi:rare lipoprotein A
LKFFGETTYSPSALFEVCFGDVHIRLVADIRPVIAVIPLSLVRKTVPALAATLAALFCVRFALPAAPLPALGARTAQVARTQRPAAKGEPLETGRASWYGSEGDGFHYSRTANGETMDPEAWTCAHKSLPFGTLVLVENALNHRTTILRVNDRGPYIRGRIIDLSRRGAAEIGLLGHGVAPVRIWRVEGMLRGHVTESAYMPNAAPAPAPAHEYGDFLGIWSEPLLRLGDMRLRHAEARPAPTQRQKDAGGDGRDSGNRRAPFTRRESQP